MSFLKVGPTYLYDGRPDSLVYHDHSFHVLDIKASRSNLRYFLYLICNQVCQCCAIGFGTVDELRPSPGLLPEAIDDRRCQDEADGNHKEDLKDTELKEQVQTSQDEGDPI